MDEKGAFNEYACMGMGMGMGMGVCMSNGGMRKDHLMSNDA